MRTASVVCTTTLDRTMESLLQSGDTFDFTIIEEAGKSYPSELIAPLSISMNTLVIGDHLQLPPFELSEIQKAIEDCIEDGLRNWDDRDFNRSIGRELVELSTQHSKRGEFDATSISDEIRAWLEPFQLIHRITDGDVLSSQWRMFQALSDSIGEIFYGTPFSLEKVNSVGDDQLPGVFGEHDERLLIADIPNIKKYKEERERKIVSQQG